MDITQEESKIGFEQKGDGVVLALGRGLFAVKILQAGEVRYAICDEAMNLIYPTASSLGELAQRFDLEGRRAG